MAKKNEALLKRIQERYRYATAAWKDIKAEGAVDMNYIAGNPWPDEDKKDRKAAGRPALAMDELGQYCNQAINNTRQNEPGIKLDPAGEDATDQTAEFHQDLIRSIEYESNAQRNAYTPAFENALQRSYGFFRISREWVPGKFEQRIRIKGISNPDTVTYDPDVMEPDWSDAKYCFIAVPYQKDDFKKKFPNAEHSDFSAEDMNTLPEWLREGHIVVAEYFEAQIEKRSLLLVSINGTTAQVYEDELPEGMDYKSLKESGSIINERNEEQRKIKKYLTNGLEILEESEEPGTFIPIPAVIGKEMWVNESGRTKRIILSLVRLARDPQMAYNYFCSQEAEEAGLSPKTPFVGYKGQFESDKVAWENLAHIPRSFVQVDVVVDGHTQEVLPLPTRPQFVPNFGQYQTAKQGAKMAIQSAMGIQPLPTAAQRQNEKSGVALEKIQTQEAIGSFHFTDNFHRALEFAGRIIEQWIPIVYDTERTVALRAADGKHRMVKLNTSEPYLDEKGNQHHYPTDKGEHNVTVSVGPSMKSQREDAADFLDTLLKVLPTLPIPPASQAKLLALGIKMRQLGPIGDQIVQVVEGDPNAQQGQQAIQQLQMAGQQIQQLQAELSKLLMDKQAKTLELQSKERLQQMEFDNAFALKKLEMEHQETMAEITTKSQKIEERIAFIEDMWKQLHGQAHDAGLQAMQHAHERQQAEAAQSANIQQQAGGDQPQALELGAQQ